MIGQLCAFAADMASCELTIDQAYLMGELHRQCLDCDCQHRGVTMPFGQYFPPRCSVCYRRVAISRKSKVIVWHRSSGASCPGSGKQDLVKAIALGATWSSLSSASETAND